MIAASPSFVSVWAGYRSRAAAMQALQGHAVLRAGICWNDSMPRSCCWTLSCCLQTTTVDGLSLEAVIDHLLTPLGHFSLLTDTILSFSSKKNRKYKPTHQYWKTNVQSGILDSRYKLRNRIADAKRIIFSTQYVASCPTLNLPNPLIEWNTKLLILMCNQIPVVSRPTFNRQQSTWKDASHLSTIYSW